MLNNMLDNMPTLGDWGVIFFHNEVWTKAVIIETKYTHTDFPAFSTRRLMTRFTFYSIRFRLVKIRL